MNEPVNCVNQQIHFTEGVYGTEHGPSRKAALDFLLDLNRNSTEYYDHEFIEDVWGRMTADYMFNLMEGVRRLMPYLDKAAPVAALRKIASTPVEGRRTFWREPPTFLMGSKRGFWMRTVIPELQMAKRREDTKLAFQRYMKNGELNPAKAVMKLFKTRRKERRNKVIQALVDHHRQPRKRLWRRRAKRGNIRQATDSAVQNAT